MTEPPTTPPSSHPAPEPAVVRPTPAVEPPRRRFPLGTLVTGLLLVLVGLGWLLETTDVVDLPWDSLLPAALIVVGVALMFASRTGSHGGLIGVGVVLTILSVLTVGLDLPLRGGVGERDETPTTAAELETTYELAVGELSLDLSEVPFPTGTTEIEASVGMGQLRVITPESGVAIRVEADASLGDVQVVDEQESGFGPSLTVVQPGYGSAPSRLFLTLSVGLGEVEVE